MLNKCLDLILFLKEFVAHMHVLEYDTAKLIKVLFSRKIRPEEKALND